MRGANLNGWIRPVAVLRPHSVKRSFNTQEQGDLAGKNSHPVQASLFGLKAIVHVLN